MTRSANELVWPSKKRLQVVRQSESIRKAGKGREEVGGGRGAATVLPRLVLGQFDHNPLLRHKPGHWGPPSFLREGSMSHHQLTGGRLCWESWLLVGKLKVDNLSLSWLRSWADNLSLQCWWRRLLDACYSATGWQPVFHLLATGVSQSQITKIRKQG